jgi:alkaline phosphatase D
VTLLLGDNIYADTTSPDTMRRQYGVLGRGVAFGRLREESRVFAIWDDHDYGRNDAGREFPIREESESIFLEFWDAPADDPRRERPGIYADEFLDLAGMRVQLILLDTRYFRSRLPRAADPPPEKGPYGRTGEAGATMLGSAQWQWLEDALGRSADLRIVASSIQVLAEHHGYESWSNFPSELDRLLSLVGGDDAPPTLFVSGDRHFSEISAREVGGRRLIDLTASSVNIPYPEPEPTPNRYRIGSYYLKSNVMHLSLRREPEIRLTAEVLDTNGSVVVSQSFRWENRRGWTRPSR